MACVPVKRLPSLSESQLPDPKAGMTVGPFLTLLSGQLGKQVGGEQRRVNSQRLAVTPSASGAPDV